MHSVGRFPPWLPPALAGATGILLAGTLLAGRALDVGARETSDPPATGTSYVAQPLHPLHAAFVPGLARDALPATLSVSTSSIYQGGTVRLTAKDVQSATAHFLGQEVPLAIAGGRGSTYLGVPPEAPVGNTTLYLDAIDRSGADVTLRVQITVLQTHWTVDYITLPPGVGGGLTPEIIQAEADRLAAIYRQVTDPVWDVPWLSPVLPGTGISGYFGEQRSFDGGPPTGHHGGTDFASAANDPVTATNGGTVVLADELAVRGRTVIIDHGGGVHSGYSHLQAIAVATGQQVAPGQLVGRVGTTGLSTGPHLHWEVAVHGLLVDGLRWLDGTQGF